MFLADHPVTHRCAAAFALLIGLSLSACTGAPDAEQPADPDSPLAVVDSGLATPESVLWDAARNVWYVSNINGQPPAKDDNGYIVRLGPDGAMLDSLPFINGADDDVTLHGPKGMALVGDTLWVADIDAVRAFHVLSGTEVATVDLAPMQATFLNDVAVGNDGTIYITDSGIAFDASGNMTHPGKSRVFALNGRTAEEAVELPRESAANGIAWHPTLDAWMIVGFNTTDIYAWVPGTSTATVIGSGAGGGDGVVVLADGRAVYASWADSSLNVFEGGASSTLRKGLPAPADLGYDPARGIIAVPLFQNDRVEFWRAP
jgi:sugar lactone lactonase YvrE